MVAADALGAVLVASVPVADWLGVLTVTQVLVVAFLGPTVAVFFDGASFGAIPMLVGRERIGAANAVTWGLQSGNEIVLPAVVGLALAVLHPSTLLAFDAVTFAVSAVLIAGITRATYDAGRDLPPLTLRQVGRDVCDGLDFLVHHAGVRTMTLIGFLQCVGGGGFVALMVVWIDRRLGVGTEGLRFGLVYGGWAVGGLIASLALPWLLRRWSAARVALLAVPISCAVGLVVPAITQGWLAALAMTAWSVGYTMIAMNSISYRQEVTPNHLLGRVNTAGRMLSWGVGWTGGAFLAGAVVDLLGLVPTLYLLAATAVLSVVVAWSSPLRGGGVNSA